ncbi:type II toxin-antitoxin system VapC family toxin [Pseudomonas tolaasii]|uniref:Ribonuclease VapC n=2 Tax=Pseudomonas tolaasii TaxID=29442 RepID=A0A7Y8AL69_PSETO|nr:type II toxin-antitoxin system VapC family toxin [Pseudomonas tolaasii]ARB27950.1 VapC toxin family PIN domain ribonuclease [Pseudomonas tolaasii]KAB0477788.1 type II toxin-antitoxin system VapC family toxin [Pseudomonas tolaasii]MBW4795742.1 type II toxin-antitoxin system VapC family toxin [Pseudomonas tolaasii]MBY8942654.1 type II toxin-antitoxin system VapC family toxin [Pseudomonas tolaasii]NVZ44345.1 type II toxin-antitoxin system VapC family toxin [Pseudomonas tolaasii]
MYLLDTNVISELRKPQANANVVAWAKSVIAARLFISAITLKELETGVLRIERRDAAQGKVLRTWLKRHVMPAFDARILPVDAAVALRCAHLHVPDKANESDALIAATALVHGFTVVTRNVSDFIFSGVNVINPWEE